MGLRCLSVRAPGPLVLLLLLAAAGGALHVGASRSPFLTGRSLLVEDQSCYNPLTKCSGDDECQSACPSAYDCLRIEAKDGKGGLKSTCTNVFNVDLKGDPVPVLPVLPAGKSIDPLDENLCSDWKELLTGGLTEQQLYLAPMFNGGDCTKERLGALYAVYDCDKKRVCFKATSCVGNTAKNQIGPNKAANAANCPGVACGCANQQQATDECLPTKLDSKENWLYVDKQCETDGPRLSPTKFGYSPAPTFKPTGWEFCTNVPQGETRVVQAHFDATFEGNFATVDNQRPNSAPQFIRFRTPQCPTVEGSCGPITVEAPVVCADDPTATAKFTVITNEQVFVTKQCPGELAVTEGPLGPFSSTVSVTCNKPNPGGWSGAKISLKITDGNPSTTPACSEVKAEADVGLKSPLGIDIEDSDEPNCWTATQVVATFIVEADASLADLTLTPTTTTADDTCLYTIEEQDSPFTVVVTCSGTYTDDVDVKLTVSGSTDSTCPNTEFLEVTVEKPGFTLTPPGEVCVTGDEFEAEFTLEDEVALGAYNTWAEDGNSFVVTPLKNAAGDEATDVECEGPTFDSTAKTFTVTCTPTTVGGTFPKDVVGFVGVKLQVTAKDSCGNTLEAVDATAAVQLGPYLDISVKTSPEICPDATSATAVFTYSTKHSSEIPTFEVLTPSGCASTVDSSKREVTVACTWTAGATIPEEIKIEGTLGGNSLCEDVDVEKSADVTVDEEPTIVLGTGVPLSTCASPSALEASFSYSITSDADATGSLSAKVKINSQDVTSSCTFMVDEVATSSMSVTEDEEKSGTITVRCSATSPATYPAGSSPIITLKLTLSKNSCTYIERSTASFGPLNCCNEDTSYAAIVSTGGERRTCFKGSGTTCTNKGYRWGFYIRNSEIGTNPIKFIAGGGDDCRKGREVGYANLKCNTAVGGGAPTSLTFEITNFAASVLDDQHYYVGCKPVTTCSPPAFGGTRANSLKLNTPCKLGDTDRNGKTIVACGDSFPTTTSTSQGDWTKQTFTIGVEDAAKAGCNSCNDVVWVVHQSGTYKGKHPGQCGTVVTIPTTQERTAPVPGTKKGRKRNPKRGSKPSP